MGALSLLGRLVLGSPEREDARPDEAVAAVANRVGPVLARHRPDLQPMLFDALRISWDVLGVPVLHGRIIPHDLREDLTEALRLTEAEAKALGARALPQGTIRDRGPWRLWIGDARHVPKDTDIDPKILRGVPTHATAGTQVVLGGDGRLLPRR